MTMSSRIGPYDVDREIGRGGMGVVFLAHDPRLERRVALKSLPAEFAADPAMRARFEREARLLAGLNHPNIAAMHGLEEADGATYIVLEYVEGQTLGDRLAHSRMAVDEAISLCAQVAAAVESAHEAGVIHRDLKPGNIMLTGDGKVKVLDFGLAREAPSQRSAASMAQAETIRRSPVTQEGRVVGTPGYMSPEQARGRTLDRRTDVWSFGCILYECLSGEMAFGGETTSDSIAAILERDPEWSKLPPHTPLRVRELLRRCLAKDVKSRQRDAGDARLELEQALANREWSTANMLTAAAMAAHGWRTRAAAPWVFAVVALAALAITWLRGSAGFGSLEAVKPDASTTPVRSTIVLPNEPRFDGEIWGLRPDGRAIYYIASMPTGPDAGVPQLFMRRLDDFEVKPVAGTLGITGFGFAPDSKWLVFTSYSDPAHERARLSKVAAEGGVPVMLIEGTGDYFRMPTWLDDGTIVLRRGQQGRELASVPPGGGAIRTILALGPDDPPYTIDGLTGCHDSRSRWVIATIPTLDSNGFRGSLWGVNVATGEHRQILDHGSGGFVVRGYIYFSRGESLLTAAFDPERCVITGSVVPLMNGLRSYVGSDSWMWDISDNGTLVYGPGGVIFGDLQLATVDVAGKVEPLSKVRASFVDSAVPSPDGSMVCGEIVESNGLFGLYVYHIADGRLRRLPAPGVDCGNPIWMPQNKQILYTGLLEGSIMRVYRRRVDGLGEPELMFEASKDQPKMQPMDVNANSPGVVCRRVLPGAPSDLVLLLANKQVMPLLSTSANEPTGHLSPDGNWLAYLSDASGRMELYVKRMPELQPGRPVVPNDEQSLMVSTSGADNPRWSRDGTTLYFSEPPGRWMKSAITVEPALAATKPEFLFNLEPLRMANNYLESGPGEGQFTFIQRDPIEDSLTQINVVQNWQAEIKEKIAAGTSTPPSSP